MKVIHWEKGKKAALWARPFLDFRSSTPKASLTSNGASKAPQGFAPKHRWCLIRAVTTVKYLKFKERKSSRSMSHRSKHRENQLSLYSLPMQVPVRVFGPNFCREQFELTWSTGSQPAHPSQSSSLFLPVHWVLRGLTAETAQSAALAPAQLKSAVSGQRGGSVRADSAAAVTAQTLCSRATQGAVRKAWGGMWMAIPGAVWLWKVCHVPDVHPHPLCTQMYTQCPRRRLQGQWWSCQECTAPGSCCAVLPPHSRHPAALWEGSLFTWEMDEVEAGM